MTESIHLPSDLELSFPCRELVRQVGELHAAFLCQRLWFDLAHQARLHGRSGLYRAGHLHYFRRAVEQVVFPKDATDPLLLALASSGLVQVQANGDWFCPLFFEHNPHLDASYIPPTAKWMKEWVALEDRLKGQVKKLADQVPEPCWKLDDGSIILHSTMHRALVLLHTLDLIFYRKTRKTELYSRPVIHSACSVVSQHSDAKLSVALQRLFSLSRPRLNPRIPPTTEAALQNFDDVLLLCLPDEGFEPWANRRLSSPREPTQPDSIRAEIAEQIAGISSR